MSVENEKRENRKAPRSLPFEIEDPKVRLSPFTINKLLLHFDEVKKLSNKGVIEIHPIVHAFFEQLQNKFDVFFVDDEGEENGSLGKNAA